ncbi:flagellar hook assembly protein FlgD [Paenibacillaceae bacterium]|nr:flagellar hook assembly protein FlgD [Paenibacillaceae bacterium]
MANDNVSTKNIWPYYHQNNVQAAVAKSKEKDSTLGKDDFLKILVTQLKHQDPLQPLQDRDFIAQMAQFSSVEQLANMAKELTLMRQNLGTASSMINKTVEWIKWSENGQSEVLTGTVESVVQKEGKLYAKVGDETILLDDVISISMGGEPDESNETNEPDKPGEPIDE